MTDGRSIPRVSHATAMHNKCQQRLKSEQTLTSNLNRSFNEIGVYIKISSSTRKQPIFIQFYCLRPPSKKAVTKKSGTPQRVPSRKLE